MTKTFMNDIKKIWKKEGFKVHTIGVAPISDSECEWKIIAEEIA